MIKCVKHHDPEDSDREQPGPSRDGVIDSRGNADAILRNRIHHSGCKRRNTYSHSHPKYNDSREKVLPVTGVHIGQHEKREAKGCD